MTLEQTPPPPSPSYPTDASVRTPPPAAQASPTPPTQAGKNPPAQPNTLWYGLILSAVWIGIVGAVLLMTGLGSNLQSASLLNWSIGISAITSPIALIWMVTAYLQRASDVQSVADPLRRHLAIITGESGTAEVRVRRFNQALREQIDTLKNLQTLTNEDLLNTLEQVKGNRDEIAKFESSGLNQIRQIQEIISRNMRQVDQMMEEKFSMLQALDDKLTRNGGNLSKKTEVVRDQIVGLLEDMEKLGTQIATSMEQAAVSSQKLSDTSRAQEASLLAAAETAAENLASLSGKIDVNIAHFLERASAARTEAEMMAGALEAQTRSMDELTSTIPARVSEAETVLRGVADRLYASEELARDQAMKLSDKLSMQTEGLQQTMDRFASRLKEIDGGLGKHKSDFDVMVERLSKTSDQMEGQWQGAFGSLTLGVEGAVGKLNSASDMARRSVDDAAKFLGDAADRYEANTRRITSLSNDGNAQLKLLANEMGSQISQFETLRNTATQAGHDVQERAKGATQNLQAVLDRLLATREATQSVGEVLVDKLHDAVKHNEQLIGRLNESAQMSVHALNIAAETLIQKENMLANGADVAQGVLRDAAGQIESRVAESERGLRAQIVGLTQLLSETENEIGKADQKLQEFASRAVAPVQEAVRQIDASSVLGLQSMYKYGEGINDRLTQMQQFNSRITSMGDELGRGTSDMLTNISQMVDKFATAQKTIDEKARQGYNDFTQITEELQKKVGGFGDQVNTAVAVLAKATSQVGEETKNLAFETEKSSTQIQNVAKSLQDETSIVRQALQKQAADLADDLVHSESKFQALGTHLKEHTDAAFEMIDRVASRYNDVTQIAVVDMNQSADKFERVITEAQKNADRFTHNLKEQVGLLDSGSDKIQKYTAEIAETSVRGLNQLAQYHEKLAMTNDVTKQTADNVAARFDDVGRSFDKQRETLHNATQMALSSMQKAGGGFEEQTQKILGATQKVGQDMRDMSSVTASLADQVATARHAIEQQNDKFTTILMDNVSKVESGTQRLQGASDTAMRSTAEAASRIQDVASIATTRLMQNQQDLQNSAQKAEDALSNLGGHVTREAGNLDKIGQQLEIQYRNLSSAQELQRNQMLELLSKITGAHENASDVAARTLDRLGESAQQVEKYLASLATQSQEAVQNVDKASASFGEQSSTLIQNARDAEAQARQVLSVTSSLQEQAKQLSDSMRSEGERASGMMGALLDKLGLGSGVLRDLGGNVETVMRNMQNGLGQQTQSLDSLMQQISDRQRTLNASLEAGRDVLGGLLNRLVLAQDETASSSDRVVARLQDGAVQITNQIVAIDEKAQNAMGSIRGASAGFVAEADKIAATALYAEEKIKLANKATADMQAQSGKMYGAIQEDVARVMGNLDALSGKFGDAQDNLKQTSTATIKSVEEASTQFNSLAQNVNVTLKQQSDALLNIASNTDRQVAGAGEAIRGHLRLVNEASEKAEKQARGLTEGTMQAVGSLDKLRHAMEEADKVGRAMLVEASARISEVKNNLQSELRNLGATTQQATAQVLEAARALNTQNDVLRHDMDKTGGFVGKMTAMVRDEIAKLPMMIEQNTTKIDGVVQTLKAHAADVSQTLSGSADEFNKATEGAKQTMTREAESLGHVAAQVEKLLHGFGGTLADQIGALTHASGHFSNEQQELVAKAKQAVDQLASAGARLGTLRQDASGWAEKLGRDFEVLESKARGANEGLSQTSANAAKNIENLAKTTQQAESQMQQSSNVFKDQMERVRVGVQAQIEDINRGLSQITSQLDRTSTALRGASTGAMADVEKTAAHFEQSTKNTAILMNDKTSAMRLATDDAARLLNSLGDHLDRLTEKTTMAGAGIRRQEGDVVGMLEKSLDQLSAVAEKLEATRDLSYSVSEQAVAKLQDVATTAQKNLHEMAVTAQYKVSQLAGGAETATGLLQGVGQVYDKQVEKLDDSVGQTQNQIQYMNKMVDDMQQRTDRMRVALRLQGDELMSSLEQILQQLGNMGDHVDGNIERFLQDQIGRNKVI